MPEKLHVTKQGNEANSPGDGPPDWADFNAGSIIQPPQSAAGVGARPWRRIRCARPTRTVIAQSRRAYWNGRGAWPGIGDGFLETDLPFQSTWDSSRAEPGRDGLLTNYMGGTPGAAFRPYGPYTTSRDCGTTAGYAQEFLAELELTWPGIGVHYTGLATLSYPTGDPNLLGSYSTYQVGQYTQFGDYEKVPEGPIHFAGEHTLTTSRASWKAAHDQASAQRAKSWRSSPEDRRVIVSCADPD